MAFAMGSAHFDAAPRPGVALAVGVSLALHAAVLALLPDGPAPLPGNSAAPLLRVELTRPAPRPATTPVVAKPEPAPRISTPEPPRPAPSSRVETPPRMPEPRTARIPETRPETGAARSTTAPARPRSAASTRTAGQQAPPPPAGTRAAEATPGAPTAPAPILPTAAGPAGPGPAPGLAAEVRRIIRLRLAGEFRYPVLARRRGWEGEVVLAFRVDADGRIGNVKVANSSGFGLLDSAARDALLRVAAVALADGRRPGTPLDLTLPVIYRLSEG